MNGCLADRLRVESREVQRYRPFFGKPDQHTLAVHRMREVEPFRDDWLVRHALRTIVYRGSQYVEVSQPHRLVLIRARRIEILDDNLIFAELVVKTAIAEERKRIRRTPDLLRGLLGSKDPVVAVFDRSKAVNEIARSEAAKPAVFPRDRVNRFLRR